MRSLRSLAAALTVAVALLAAAAAPALPQDISVGPGDVLQIAVLGEPEVSGPQTVDPNGNIGLPLVGEVQVAGLTLDQVGAKVTAALKKFIREPQVVVTFRQTAARPEFVYLLGRVGRPGAYQMQPGWTVAELLAVAGGPGPGAALPRALILRGPETIPIDLQRLLVDGDAQANAVLQPGDVVIVPETKNRVILMGDVAKPGAYVFTPGDRIVDALSAAGGPTSGASLKDIGIIRQAGQKATVIPVDLTKFYRGGDLAQNALLRPGDIVYVPGRSGVNWSSVLGGLNGLSYLLLLLK